MKGFKVIRDYETGKGIDLDISVSVFDVETIRNNVEERLKILHGEARYNELLGFRMAAHKDELDLYTKRTILETQGVLEILRFTSTLKNRVYSVEVEINTNVGLFIFRS